ncbi:sugar ABC transporter substrate-binding protein [Modestobacter sp. Leaf380]|uniref:sugar ABC transporter substrate-binding protein n=1 Tax=Modestobacter sp. Leaf380 TaxID=1736356 RepID=UPI0006FF5241|nr:sugar ABC transporter substrate-binding protein [Modestobacter sp. Leaf380]KQS73755.1 sugar ABC transporter substrate-binding protein [Modestobacter sp. Leaf380]
MARPQRLLALALAAPLLLSACSGGDEPTATGADGDSLTFAVVTHGSPGDAFWDVVQNGAVQAGEDLGIEVDYQSDGDPQRQSQLIEAAVNQGVDGIVVSMANPEALQSAVEDAVAAGIPVVTINSGAAESVEFGAIGHVGQDETIAGQGAGERLATDGRTNVLCVVHEAGNIGLEQRCDGASQGLGSDVTTLQVDINDLAAAESTITSSLQSDPSIDAVLTLNSAVAAVAASAATDAGSEAEIATFDLNADVISGIQEGTISFAVDQQQFEQGYLPVVMLQLYAQNLNTVGGGQPVLTGPGIVDSENVDEIADLATAGTR